MSTCADKIGKSLPGIPGIPGLFGSVSDSKCDQCIEQCSTLLSVSEEGYYACLKSCAQVGGGGGDGLTQSQRDAITRDCIKSSVSDTIKLFGSASAEGATAWQERAYNECLVAHGLPSRGTSDLGASPYQLSGCAECGIDDIPSCLACLAGTLSKGLVTIGVNVGFAALVLLGIYLLFHEEVNTAVKGGVKAAKLLV